MPTKVCSVCPRRTDAARRMLPHALAVVFWLCAWQVLSVAVGQDVLIVSPVTAIRTLLRLMGTASFYQAVAASFSRILLGFFIACCMGVLLSILAARRSFVKVLLAPMMSTIKATPVASFVILALVWISAANLSIFTSFLMVLPIVYQSVLTGLEGADVKLLEMARVFRMKGTRRARAIYLPAAFPYFLTACKMSLGMCWKAGIAAEVIGQPANSIGDKLYRAKLFLSTDELFAWTLAIILLSVFIERVMVWAINKLQYVYERSAA